MEPGWSNDNPLDNAVVVLAAQLMAPLMPFAASPGQIIDAAERATHAARALLVAAGWTLPDA